MENLKILRGLLACIAILESASTNSVNAQCEDRHGCEQYSFPLVCERIGKEWFLKNCPKSCKACPADQLSNMYVENSTIILISSKSTIPEERNVTDVNKVSVQPERTTGTTRILLSTGGAATCLDKADCSIYRIPLDCTRHPWYRENCQASCNTCPGGTSKTTRTSTRKASSHTRHMTPSKRVASVTVSSGACKDDKVCTGLKELHRRCSGTDGWYREHCRLSCNTCLTDQVSVTRDISHTSTPSHPQRTVVTTWIPPPAAASEECKDDNECTQYKDLHRRCSGTDGWFRQHCRLSCNMCITDQVSVTREISQTATSPLKARNVTVQVPDDVSQASGVCKDDNECTRYKDLHRLCSGTDGWYRKHCRLSCNLCINDQVSVTRDISHKSTTSPVKAMNVSVQEHDVVSQATSPVRSKHVSVQVHDDVSLATSPVKSRNVSEQVGLHDDASQDFPESASYLPSLHQNVIIAVVIIAVIILIVFIAGVVIFKKRRDKSSGKNPLQPTHKDMWSSDGQVDFTNVYQQTVLFSPDQRDQSSDQNHVIDINPPKQSTEETELRDTCTVSVNKDGLVYSILDFKDFQPKDFVPPSPTERIEYATIDFGGTISCTKNTRD